MKKLSWILITAGTLIPAVAFCESATTSSSQFSEMNGWKLSAGATSMREGHSVDFVFTSPMDVSEDKSRRHGKWGIAGLIGWTKIYNRVVHGGSFNSGATYSDPATLYFGAALEGRSTMASDLVNGYMRVGAANYDLDSQLTRNNPWAFLFQTGLDIRTSEMYRKSSGSMLTSGFYMQLTWIAFAGKAEKLTGDPDVLNGVFPSFGIRWFN